jgi:hypothetical protein
MFIAWQTIAHNMRLRIKGAPYFIYRTLKKTNNDTKTSAEKKKLRIETVNGNGNNPRTYVEAVVEEKEKTELNETMNLNKKKVKLLIDPGSTVSLLKCEKIGEKGGHVLAANGKSKMAVSKPKEYTISIQGVQTDGELRRIKKLDCAGILGVDWCKKNRVTLPYDEEIGNINALSECVEDQELELALDDFCKESTGLQKHRSTDFFIKVEDISKFKNEPLRPLSDSDRETLQEYL